MISAQDTIKIASKYYSYLNHNYDLMQILEGNLAPYIEKALAVQLKPQSYQQAMYRMFPVNMLTKVIDKLTNIYQTSITREIIGGSEKDEKLLQWYVDQMQMNTVMNCANELYNLCKGTLLYPSVYEGKPFLRPEQNNKFIVISQNKLRPDLPTDVIILAGRKQDKDVYWVIDETSFVVYTGGMIDYQEMAAIGNPEGVNPFGRLPYVWVNDSKYNVMPIQDTSVMRVITTVPVILSDLNLAAMFQTFSILYAIDLDDEAIKFAPNAIWKFKSDPATDKKPEVGQIKPQVDIDQVIRLVETELGMWLGSKGIRPGSIGTLNAENFASGISKVIDEMDTYEARQKQVATFQHAEERLWDLIFNYMHPYWVQTGQIENRELFTPGAKVKTTFAVQLPQQSRGTIVRDLRDEVAAGFTTRRVAIEKLNPQLSQKEIDQLIADIDSERPALENGSEDIMVQNQTDNPEVENQMMDDIDGLAGSESN